MKLKECPLGQVPVDLNALPGVFQPIAVGPKMEFNEDRNAPKVQAVNALGLFKFELQVMYVAPPREDGTLVLPQTLAVIFYARTAPVFKPTSKVEIKGLRANVWQVGNNAGWSFMCDDLVLDGVSTATGASAAPAKEVK